LHEHPVEVAELLGVAFGLVGHVLVGDHGLDGNVFGKLPLQLEVQSGVHEHVLGVAERQAPGEAAAFGDALGGEKLLAPLPEDGSQGVFAAEVHHGVVAFGIAVEHGFGQVGRKGPVADQHRVGQVFSREPDGVAARVVGDAQRRVDGGQDLQRGR
jgi:hypothetical protein